MYRLSTESYTLLDHLLCSILACTPNLLTLDIQNTDVSLQESVVNAINNHPTLDRVTLENFRQLNDLPIDFCARTSFGRIHVQGLKLDRGLPPFPGGVLNALCQRSPESSLPGPHVYALQVEYFTSSAWIDLTFGSISELTVRDVDDTFASGCGGFFDRHPSLKAIHLDGYGLKHELALGSIPCLRELYRKSVKMGNGMERGFSVFSVKLSKRGHSQSHSFNNLAATVRGHEATESTNISGDPGWILKSISFTILQDTERVLPFILENLPPCEDLYIEREREVADESTNVTQVGLYFSPLTNTCTLAYKTSTPSQSVLWDTILSSTRNLSHLISFGYSTFPLCDTAPSLPVRFGPSYDDYGEEDGGEYEDYFCSDELEDAREALSVFVERMARKCPRLEAVAIAGPEGYEISGYYLKFQVERTEKRGNGEGEGESEEEVTVSRDLRMYK